MFEIPKSFKLAGQEIHVELSKTLQKDKHLLGQADYESSKIYISSTMRNRLQIEQTFFHELVHWVFYIMNEDSLRKDEKRVDLIAHMLHQAFSTFEHD